MKKQKKTPRVRRWLIAGIFLLILVLISGFLITGYVSSRLVHIDRTTLYIEDLPSVFDGKTILFVSDVDMVGLSGPRAAGRLMNKLEKLEPDILILGGDYAGYSLMEKLNGTGSDPALEEKRLEFFGALSEFQAPMGKFAVTGEQDAGSLDMRSEMARGNVTLLSDSAAKVGYMGESVTLVGIDGSPGHSVDYGLLAQSFASDDCVIVISHDPANISGVITAEAADTGQWCDLALSGHTHGGQAVVGERSLIQISDQSTRYPTGWSKESGVFILVSPGVGCDTVNLRLNAQAQAHLITLRKPLSFTMSE